MKGECRYKSNEHQHVVYADLANVSDMKLVNDTLKSHSVSGSRVVQQKPQAGVTPTQEWQLYVAYMSCVCHS
jgi:hypothetical protein